MTKRIFWAIFSVALTILLTATILVLAILHGHFINTQFAQLRVETALASHAVTNEGAQYFDKLDDTLDCRITWIGSDGTVLYDNLEDPGTMGNHLHREEVRSALETGYGQSQRYSDTLLERYIYAAERLPDGTVLRLSMSQNSIFKLLMEMSGTIFLILAAAIGLSYVLARRLARSVVKPLNELNLKDPLSNQTYPEVRPLLRRLHVQQDQLHQQAEALEQKQKEFHTATQALSEGLILLNDSGYILSINPAAVRLLGVTPNCVGADFSVASTNAAITALAEQALQGQKAQQTVSLAAGDFLAAARPVFSGGTLSGVAVLLFDVTQQHQAELLRREFTANVSHELKTPLHVISGYAELLKSGLVPAEDTTKSAESIYREAQRMIRLVEDILRLSHLDEGATDMQWTELELTEIVRGVLQELAAPAALAEVRLCQQGSCGSIRSISQLVTSIVFNLVDNAIKYNRPGGSVTVTLRQQADAVLLTVTDTGIGIPEADRDRVFERFYRVDKSHSKAAGGTGLGLSIVKHAAQILNASLKLESHPGEGTTVTIRFVK